MRLGYPQLLVGLQFGLIIVMVMLMIPHAIFKPFAVIILLAGIAIGLWAIKHHPADNFNIVPELKEGCRLVTHGLYRYIRHPMYTSVILMQLGVVLFYPVWYLWVLWFALVVVLYLKASREERLWMAHDACYREYREKTRYFIPYIL
ncbi:MAG: isoprenylcysteine carboxylmethyltransferase family protein [Sulfurovum sp.]|nr:isoprenylcysteine carboxylmethyltransferase family protein [Sulfurovum sp.]